MRRGLLPGVVLLYLTGVFFLMGAVPLPQELPPPPNTFRGVAMIGDRPATTDMQIYACVSDCAAYKTAPVSVEQGGRFFIVVGPPSRAFFNRPVFFYITRGYGGDVKAQESDKFTSEAFREVFLVLHFPGEPAPPPQTPTPTPTPTPALPITGDTTLTAIPRVALMAGALMVVVGVLLLAVVRVRTQRA